MKRYEMDLVAIFTTLFLVTCITNCSGDKGDNGDVGAPGKDGQSIVGPQGPAGAPGSPGLNTTPVTAVQLCPGVPSYPGVFIEVGLCINNKLYAVYSAHDGFMTYLPPGNYSSKAIGSACNLTVHTNCVVSH